MAEQEFAKQAAAMGGDMSLPERPEGMTDEEYADYVCEQEFAKQAAAMGGDMSLPDRPEGMTDEEYADYVCELEFQKQTSGVSQEEMQAAQEAYAAEQAALAERYERPDGMSDQQFAEYLAEKAWEEAQKQSELMMDVKEEDEGAIGNISWEVDFKDLVFSEDDGFGSGSFGCVFRGLYFGTDVAIKKLIYPEDMDIQKYIDREMEVLRGMRHPNIVQLLGLCVHNDDLYLITDFLKEGNLRHFLKDMTKIIPWRRRVIWAKDTVKALSYMHSKGILHRDIKSKNLLLDDGAKKIKLCDFGFARRFEDKFKRRMTICGTDCWMAPEIVMGMEYDWMADVYSLGVVMLEIITRISATKFPRRVEEAYALDRKEMNKLIPSDAPPEFVALAFTAADKDPKNRFTLNVLLEKLSAIAATLPEEDISVKITNPDDVWSFQKKEIPKWEEKLPETEEEVKVYKEFMKERYNIKKFNEQGELIEHLQRQIDELVAGNMKLDSENVRLKALIEQLFNELSNFGSQLKRSGPSTPRGKRSITVSV